MRETMPVVLAPGRFLLTARKSCPRVKFFRCRCKSSKVESPSGETGERREFARVAAIFPGKPALIANPIILPSGCKYIHARCRCKLVATSLASSRSLNASDPRRLLPINKFVYARFGISGLVFRWRSDTARSMVLAIYTRPVSTDSA